MKKILLLPIFALTIALSSCAQESDKQANMDNTENKMINEKETMESSDTKTTDDENTEDSIVLEDEDGKQVALADYKGKKTYVKFWASWCPVCLTGLEEFDQMSQNVSDYNIVSVVAPEQFGEKSKEDFIEWFDGLGYKDTEVLYDTNADFVEEFDIRSTPTNVFIDSKGNIVKTAPGQIGKEIVDEIMAEIN